MKYTIYMAGILSIGLFAQCNEMNSRTTSTSSNSSDANADTAIHVASAAATPQYESLSTTYHTINSKDSIRKILSLFNGEQLRIILAINRTDSANIVKQKSVLVPDKIDGNIMQYTSFPQQVPFLKDVHKIVYFSYPAQFFAAYENGNLVYTGPTNMGRQKDPTPTGLFFTNWKAEETKSTFNDEWELKWNFNIENKEGIGWHQYAMPGYPASHSCLRMTEADAKYMYDWADEWTLKGTDNVLAKGTPVIVFGSYPFGGAKPWLQLVQSEHALDITVETLQAETEPHLSNIIAEQQKTATQKGK